MDSAKSDGFFRMNGGCFTTDVCPTLQSPWALGGMGRSVVILVPCHGRGNKLLAVNQMFSTMIQGIVCAIGLLGGLTIGGLIVSGSGLWNVLDRVLIAPAGAVTPFDLGLAFLTFAIVLVCGWLGMRAGMTLAQRIGE